MKFLIDEDISPKMSKGSPRFKNKCVVQTHNILSGGSGGQHSEFDSELRPQNFDQYS